MMEKTNQLRTLGIILFFVGGIVAISAGAKMPIGEATYPSTTGIFAIGLIMGIIGNVLWHQNERKKVMFELQAHKDDHTQNPVIMLKDTIPAIEKLQANFDQLPGMKLCDAIDELQDKYVHPFTERRKTFMDILGTGHGAEVLLMIAYAERMLNRVWSASSDGAPEEARECLADSLDNYKKALARMEEYLK